MVKMYIFVLLKSITQKAKLNESKYLFIYTKHLQNLHTGIIQIPQT